MNFMIDENLLEIFSKLDATSLISASLVCRRWEQLISTSASLLSKFDILITIDAEKFQLQNVFPEGKYQNLTLTTDNNFSTEIPENVKAFLANKNEYLRKATLKNVNRLQSIQVLSCLTNITKLTISNFQQTIISNGSVEMPNLKQLELQNSILFENVIRHHSVKILKLFGTLNQNERTEHDLSATLNSLLHKCGNLEELTLSNLQIANLYLQSGFFEFKLQTLTVENCNFDEENLDEFLKNQKNSLKKLAILCSEPKTTIPLTIFYELKLVELEIDVNLIPKVFNPGVVNSSIKKLTLSCDKQLVVRSIFRPMNGGPLVNNLEHLGDFQDMGGDFFNFGLFQQNQQPQNPNPGYRLGQRIQREYLAPGFPPVQLQNRVEQELRPKAAKKIISTCRALEEFMIVDFTTDSLLQQLNQTSLKVLKLQIIPHFISPAIQLDSLKVIEIDKIQGSHDVENCTFLVFYSPNLEVLKINSIPKHFDSKFFTKIISKAEKLKELHIGATCQFTLDMIRAVKTLKCRGRPLKVLSFNFVSVEDADKIEFIDIFMEGLKFNFNLCSTKFFASMINETQLGRTKREIEEKNANLKQQVEWSGVREQAIESYKYYNC